MRRQMMESRVGSIIAAIMSGGTCFILSGFVIHLVCIISIPINTSMCIEYTPEVANIFHNAGFALQSGIGIISGMFVYVFGVKGKNN